MKVLLIRPPMELLPNEIMSIVFPLGLGYIAAYLEKMGCEVKVLDAVVYGVSSTKKDGFVHFGMDWENIEEVIRKTQPDVVGISCSFSSQAENTHKTAMLVKRVCPTIKVFVGGAHPSSEPKELLKDSNIDAVVIGEGEITSYKYLSNLKNEAKLSEIDGLAFRKGRRIIINHKREFIRDLDSLPFPARHLFPMELYFKAAHGHGVDVMRKPKTEIITSRGCTGRCVYCSIHTVWGRKWRPRSPENIVDEIELLYRKYGVREIQFEDDNLSMDAGRLFKICELLIKRRLDIKWTTPNGIAIWTLNKRLLRIMKNAGCYKLTFGIESGDVETQKFIKKYVNLKKAKEIIQYSNKIGIWTHALFIIGFPYEKMESIKNTFRFAVDCDADFASFFIATPYPGTELSAIMHKEDLICDELKWSDFRVSAAAAPSKYFTEKELESIQRKLFIDFFKHRILRFSNPYLLWLRLKRIRSLEDIRFISRFFLRFMQVTK